MVGYSDIVTFNFYEYYGLMIFQKNRRNSGKKKKGLSVSWDRGKSGVLHVCVFLAGSHALFTRPTSTEFSKFFFKIRSHNTIYTFKMNFVTAFSVLVFSNKRYPNKSLKCTIGQLVS